MQREGRRFESDRLHYKTRGLGPEKPDFRRFFPLLKTTTNRAGSPRVWGKPRKIFAARKGSQERAELFALKVFRPFDRYRTAAILSLFHVAQLWLPLCSRYEVGGLFPSNFWEIRHCPRW